MAKEKLSAICIPVVTPFNKNESINDLPPILRLKTLLVNLGF